MYNLDIRERERETGVLRGMARADKNRRDDTAERSDLILDNAVTEKKPHQPER